MAIVSPFATQRDVTPSGVGGVVEASFASFERCLVQSILASAPPTSREAEMAGYL